MMDFGLPRVNNLHIFFSLGGVDAIYVWSTIPIYENAKNGFMQIKDVNEDIML